MKVIGYARISTEEQSNFSISNQVEAIEDYCNRNNYELLDVFIDEGQSAKSFDRANWKELQKFLAKNYKDVDALIVYKFDRFSRNLPEALDVIQKLELKQKIRVVSICEPIALPPESPFYFQLRTQMLLHAHVEREIIRDRTIQGIRKAKRDGRFLGKAPVGYKNARDAQNRPIIIVDEDKAPIIKKMYELAVLGYKPVELKHYAKTKGIDIRQHDGVIRILRNIVYTGKVFNRINDNETTYYQGLHEPIVDESTYNKANYNINIKERIRKLHNDEAYLKGALCCNTCYRPFTCGNSHGRSKTYWYYVCLHCKKSYSVIKANKIFDELLSSITISNSITKKVQELIDEMIENQFSNSNLIRSLSRKLNVARNKAINLEEKFIEDLIDTDNYKTWKTKYEKEINEIEKKINFLKQDKDKISKVKVALLNKLSNLAKLFSSASTQQKLALIQNWFDKNFCYDGERYRTNYVNPILEVKSIKTNLLTINKNSNKNGHLTNFPLGCPEQESNLHYLAVTRF